MSAKASAPATRDAGDLGAVAEESREDMVERALADDAEAQGGERDAELAGREVGVDVVDGVLDGLRARAAVGEPVVDLRGAHAGDRELVADEEAVRRDEDERDDDLQPGHAAAGSQSPGSAPAGILPG